MKNSNDTIMTVFRNSLKSEKTYSPNDIFSIMSEVVSTDGAGFEKSNKKVSYYNIPCSFDIEVTSFKVNTPDGEQKTAIMYIWTFGIFGRVIIGRTWADFVTMIQSISNILALDDTHRLIVGVHNLAYEFQFMRKYFNWNKVFSIDSRKPIYAVTDNGIEFRCTYLLSGYSLAKLADNLQTYDIKKLSGDLDYTKPRHSKTPITDEELAYCINDCKIVMAYLMEEIERNGGISKIPLTKTGYVRNYCRNSCFYEPNIPKKKSHKRQRYKELMWGMVLEPSEYEQLKRAFQGGFTHANAFYSGKIVEDVTSYDFTSSYPTVMIAERFPISAGELYTPKDKADFEENLQLYCCLFDVEFTGLMASEWYENYISESRCWGLNKPVVNNGRVVSADLLYTTITETDFLIIRNMYTWDSMRIRNFRRYKKDYLPTDFVKAILKLYHDKTTLKGVDGKEAEYLNSKEMLNSCYGMAVTDIVRPEYIYTDEWEEPQTPDLEKAIADYNKNGGRFLFYPWGVGYSVCPQKPVHGYTRVQHRLYIQ